MAQVFLSYDREDLDRAQGVASALEKVGHRVWWDRHIKGGAQYNREIEQALSTADSVVVLWSKGSVEQRSDPQMGCRSFSPRILRRRAR